MKKIVSISIFMLLTTTAIIGMGNEIKTIESLASGPPEDFTWHFSSNDIADWWHATVESGGQNGIVEGIEDTHGDGKIGKCDYVIVNWRNSNVRQPYYKYHIEDSWHVDDPEDPDYCRWAFVFDYNSKSRAAPKIESNCHYVDDSNTGGPWDGSYEDPYRYIRDGIDAASIGDTVLVFPGTYNENVVIDKSITLRSYPYRDYFNTNVDVYGGNSGSAVSITTDYCNLIGILVRGSYGHEEYAGIDIRSDYNTIIGNYVYDNSNGIYLHDSSSHNIITENHIYDNDFGVFIWENSNNNLIYNNIFENNNYFNAKDKCTNNWNYDYPIGGNYWDDYLGEDADGDDIGDTPHPILGEGLNFDDYPIENRTKLKNFKPAIDKFDGPTSGTKGERYGYAVRFFDDEYHDGILEIDWDDGSEIEYSEYLGAGEEYIFNHVWSEQGTYNVKVRAIDMFGAESNWETLEVSMPKNVSPNLIVRLLQKLIYLFPILEPILQPILDKL